MDPVIENRVTRPHLVGDALRRRWRVVAGCGLLLAAVVAGLTLRAAPQYVSNAAVFLQPIAGNALSPDATVNGQQVTVAMETEAGLVDSPGVVSLVADKLHLAQDQLRAHVTATVPSNTKIVQIKFSAASPRAARAGAEAFAEAYLSFREGLAQDAQDRQLAKLQEQAAAANTSLSQLALSTGTSATARRQILVSRIASLQASIGDLDATDVHPGSVSSPADLPGSSAGIDPFLFIAVGLLLGLGLGLVVVVGLEASDDKVRASAGVTIAGLPILSEMRTRRRGDVPLLLGGDETPEVAESFRQLRVGVLATAPEARVLSVSEVTGAATSGIHVANLGLAMARAGLSVSLVDATGTDALTALLGDHVRGKISGVGGRLPLAGRPDVRVVTSTTGVGEHQYVDETLLSRLVEDHRRSSDYVLVAAPSLLSSDGEVAGLAADRVLLVVEQDRTHAADLTRVAQRARLLGITFCGVFSVPARRRARRRPAVLRRTTWAPAAGRVAATGRSLGRTVGRTVGHAAGRLTGPGRAVLMRLRSADGKG
jgi:capsular polysaccharide biosynthesis protein/Mrp family chromosome partitioning ATPase